MPDPLALVLEVHEPDEPEAGAFHLGAHLGGADVVIGRDPTCDVIIEDASVSSRHGALRASAAGWVYSDLGSRNGSVLLRGRGGRAPEAAESLAPGEPALIEAGDALLLGDAGRAVRLVLRDVVAPFAAAPREPATGRTVVASAPLADLFARRDAGLETLAAHALAAPDADALAQAAHAFLVAAVPGATGRGVVLFGAGLAATAGEPVPAAVRDAALALTEVVLFEEVGGALPMTESVVAGGVAAALVAPLVASGGAHGVMAAWSSLGPAALPRAAVSQLAVGASLVALAAAQLAVRTEGEQARRRLEDENAQLRAGRDGGDGGLGVVEPVGEAPAFREVLRLARRVATADVPVLLLGETGTGKEVVARALHRWGQRAGRPFVAFNCAAVPEALIESELFGHVRGAFTGAGADKTGLFEAADGGTVFLDEVGEMPLAMQAKLLRVLQDGDVRRVGAVKSARVDVRVISATHQDLAARVADKRFREDLMYRLDAVTLRLPALRERGDDVLLLAHFLLGRACDRARKRIPGFTADALWALSRHRFPGNVRELENEVLRAVALTRAGEPIAADAFSARLLGDVPPPPAPAATPEGPLTLKDAVSAAERRAVEDALARSDGNVSQAARDLGLTRPGLYKVMERVGLRG